LTFSLVKPIGNPIIITDQSQRDNMLVRYPTARLYEFLNKMTFKAECPVDKWWEFSVTSALVTAKHLGATEIVCYGCDGSFGDAKNLTTDWDGYSDSEQVRNERRWTKEQKLWADIVDWLRKQGISVERG